jgi:hypothetical protein
MIDIRDLSSLDQIDLHHPVSFSCACGGERKTRKICSFLFDVYSYQRTRIKQDTRPSRSRKEFQVHGMHTHLYKAQRSMRCCYILPCRNATPESRVCILPVRPPCAYPAPAPRERQNFHSRNGTQFLERKAPPLLVVSLQPNVGDQITLSTSPYRAEIP